MQLAAKVEEEQGRFNWRRLHNVVFEEVPVAQWPSENRLHLLMSLVAQVSEQSVLCWLCRVGLGWVVVVLLD